jgi:hypothetical protein
MKTTLTLAFLASVACASTAIAADGATERKVMSVKSVSLTILKTGPRWLQIDSSGDVPTGGWKGGRLSAMMTMVPPADGLYAYNFVATPPTGIVNQMVSPIDVNPPDVWKGYPEKLKGVKIFSASNCMIALLPGVDSSSVKLGTCALSK